MKFGQSVLTKIIKNHCHPILMLKYTEIDFAWGSTQDPAEGAYSTPPESLAGIKGTYL